jgi:hypothetical protein
MSGITFGTKELKHSEMIKKKPISTKRMTDYIESTIKLAFYEWASKHKGGNRIVDKEWDRFLKVLRSYL